jgi:hypothetical protein
MNYNGGKKKLKAKAVVVEKLKKQMKLPAQLLKLIQLQTLLNSYEDNHSIKKWINY